MGWGACSPVPSRRGRPCSSSILAGPALNMWHLTFVPSDAPGPHDLPTHTPCLSSLPAPAFWVPWGLVSPWVLCAVPASLTVWGTGISGVDSRILSVARKSRCVSCSPTACGVEQLAGRVRGEEDGLESQDLRKGCA